MLDVGRLRVLLAVSEHGELPAAARALGTPAPDAAAQLSALERELGLTLAEDDRLTPAGRRLAGHAGRLLAQLEAAESDAAAVAGRASGVLRLGIGAAAGRALLPDALATLRSAAPDLDLRVQQLADERADALGTERLDVVVVGEFAAAVPRRADPDVLRRELLTEPLLVAVPARHRLTGASVRLAELAEERWVGGPVGGDALTALERVAATAGFEPRLVGHAAEDGLALALVAAGVGVALVPASSVPVPVDGVRFLTAVDAGLRRTVTAVVRRSGAADPDVLRRE
ncbi:MAG TPA: LysR substrate-binding domain-containing protein, partial [Mycobacteriales bacterium]|nr:LysR substrate-binding domain-containing protein [Mycobacteriales bacterium]